MNICFLNSQAVTPQTGGVESVTNRLMSLFSRHGHTVYCFNLSTQLVDGKKNTQKNVSAFRKMLEERHMDVVINQSEYHVVADLMRGVSDMTHLLCITCVHIDPACYWYETTDLLADMKLKKEGNLLKWLKTYLYLRITAPLRRRSRGGYYTSKYHDFAQVNDAIVLLSEGFFPKFQKMIGSQEQHKAHLYAIPNPLSLAYQNVPILPFEQREKIVVWCGRMISALKRPDYMVEIWQRLAHQYPDWTLYFVGDGDARKYIEKKCKRKRLTNVVFTGRIHPYEIYKKASILCMTSSCEGFGLVLTEALQNGVIPMAFDSYESARDIIKDGQNGRLIKPYDCDEYADVLSALMKDDTVRRSYYDRIMTQDYLSAFSEEKIYAAWEKLFASKQKPAVKGNEEK